MKKEIFLKMGGKIGDYTVSYDYSEGLKGLMNYEYNFICESD